MSTAALWEQELRALRDAIGTRQAQLRRLAGQALRAGHGPAARNLGDAVSLLGQALAVLPTPAAVNTAHAASLAGPESPPEQV